MAFVPSASAYFAIATRTSFRRIRARPVPNRSAGIFSSVSINARMLFALSALMPPRSSRGWHVLPLSPLPFFLRPCFLHGSESLANRSGRHFFSLLALTERVFLASGVHFARRVLFDQGILVAWKFMRVPPVGKFTFWTWFV